MSRRRSVSPPLILVGVCLAVALVVVAVIMITRTTTQRATPADYEKYSWQDSKYKGIRTRISKQHGPTYDSLIEYPVTKSSEVNQLIADAINDFDTAFHEQIAHRLPARGEHFEQNTSYQVVRLYGDFLSIEVMTTRDTGEANTQHDTKYWTFNLATSKEVTLDTIFGDTATDGKARLFIYIKRDIARQMAKKGIPYDVTRVNAAVNAGTIKSFLAPDAATIRFDFGKGIIASDADGPITVSLPIANLQLFLQSHDARHLFDIMPIGAAPEWDAPEVTKGSVDCEHVKCIALTFDDGPGPFTAELLDTLKRRHAYASFFLIGQNIARHDGLVKRMHAEGHTIGSHTWDHRVLPSLQPTVLDSEVARVNDAVQKITGTKVTYMRPPTGALGPAVYSSLKRLNMTAVMWSVDTRDWADRDSEIIYNRVIAGAKPGAVIILHDIHKTSVDAVPRIITALQRQGYAFVSIEELFGPNAAPGMAISRAS